MLSLGRTAPARTSLIQHSRLISSLSSGNAARNALQVQYARTRPRSGSLFLVPSASVALRGGLQLRRGYASGPPGGAGGGGGFPGFSMGPQHQKGDALKEYVRRDHVPCVRYNYILTRFNHMKSVDLTGLARSGKLDPTIGRDEGM